MADGGHPEHQGDPLDFAVRPVRRARCSSPTTTPIEEAEQRVINRLAEIGAAARRGAAAAVADTARSARSTATAWSGRPAIRVLDLKTLQDWVLERRFKAVPGVIDVTGWGGRTKTYDVNIDQNKLVSYGLTLPQVLTVLNNSNINVGGQTIDFAQQSAIVRGVGLISTLDGLRNTMLTSNNGTPVLLRDVATVAIGNLPRLGIAGQDQDDDIVQGIVLMRRGGESKPTIAAVEAEVEKINSTGILPPGVHIERIYDRADLIALTTHTVLHNMMEGILLIFLVQWMFLGNLRGAIIVADHHPLRAVLRRHHHGGARRSRRTCCRSARSISAWSSMPPSSWWRTSSATSPSRRSHRFDPVPELQRVRTPTELRGKFLAIAEFGASR